MQIQQNTMTFTQGNTQIMAPPPKSDPHNSPSAPSNNMPPGLGVAVESLSVEKQTEVENALASLSDEQKSALKGALDELKPQAENMALEEIGDEFLNILTQLAQQKSSSESENQLDTYI
jgi:hypothetical protein